MKAQIKHPLFQFIYQISHIAIIAFFIFVFNQAYAFNLVGTWKLTSIKSQGIHSSCYSPTGLLIYTPSGYMAAGINCMQSARHPKPSFAKQNVTFYMGKYSIKGNKVRHFIRNSSDRSYYGKRLERKIHILNNNEIVLIIKNKKGKVTQLKWKRVI